MEEEFLRWLYRRVRTEEPLIVGVGDDCSVIKKQDGNIVVTTDAVLEGVHFGSGVEPERVGYKAAAVSLSDIAAMGAEPLALYAASALPCNYGGEYARRVVEGLLSAVEPFGVQLGGGDYTLWRNPVVVVTTVVGVARNPIKRNGAKNGDIICVTGEFGGSSLGKHLDFTPRVKEALYLVDNFDIHSMIDVSDGLSLDLSRMMDVSGVGCVLYEEKIPISEAAYELSERDGISPLEHALSDGEDFELVFTLPPKEAERLIKKKIEGVSVTAIGEVTLKGGMWLIGKDERGTALKPKGYIYG